MLQTCMYDCRIGRWKLHTKFRKPACKNCVARQDISSSTSTYLLSRLTMKLSPLLFLVGGASAGKSLLDSGDDKAVRAFFLSFLLLVLVFNYSKWPFVGYLLYLH